MAKPNTTPELDTDLIENLTEEELALKLLELSEGKCAKKEGTDPDDGEDEEEDDLDSKADDGDEDEDGVLLNEKKKKKNKFKGTWMEDLDEDLDEDTFHHDVTIDPGDKIASAKYIAKHKALGVTTTLHTAPNGWSEARHTGPKHVLKKLAVKHYGHDDALELAQHLFEGTDVDDPTQVKKPEPDSKAAGDAKSIKEKELAKAGCDNATEDVNIDEGRIPAGETPEQRAHRLQNVEALELRVTRTLKTHEFKSDGSGTGKFVKGNQHIQLHGNNSRFDHHVNGKVVHSGTGRQLEAHLNSLKEDINFDEEYENIDEDLYVTEAELSEDLGMSIDMDEGYDPADVKKLKSLVKTHKKNVAKAKAHDAKMEPSYAATGNTVGHNTQKARGHMYTNTKHHMNADDSRNAVHDHVNKMKGLPPGGSEAKHLIKHGFKHNAERSEANGHPTYDKGTHSSGHGPAHSVHIHGNRFSHTEGHSSFVEKSDHMKNLGSYLAKTKTGGSTNEDLDEGAKEIQMKVNDTGTMKKSGQLAKVVVLKTGSSRYEVQEVSADGNPKGLPFKVNKLKITPSLLANLDFTEELNAIVSDEENLSEGFREKSAIIFEAALSSRLRDEKQILAEQYQTTLQEETAQILTDLSAKIDSYLTYAVEAWVGDNKVAIDESLRTEIAESLITSLKSVFVEHYIEIPESKRDLFTELEKKNAELKESADEIEKANATLAGQVQTLLRDKILTEASVGLADTQAAKLVELVEDVEFVDEDTFSKKVATLKGSFFAARKVNTPSATEKTGVKTIVEGVEDYNPEDPDMARYAAALKRANNR